MTLNITYEVSLKSDAVSSDDIKTTAHNDSLQQVSKYSSNNIPNVNTKRLDLGLSPTTVTGSDPNRIVTISLEQLNVSYIRIMHIKSLNYFMYKFGQTEAELDTNTYEVSKVLFRDYGPEIPAANFTPPTPQPKFIRFLNPSSLNGAGDANNISTNMITVSMVLITSRL